METFTIKLEGFLASVILALRLLLNQVSGLKDSWVAAEFTSWYKNSKWWLGHRQFCANLEFLSFAMVTFFK